MKTALKIIETTNVWSEEDMLESIVGDMENFGSGTGTYPRLAEVKITIRKLRLNQCIECKTIIVPGEKYCDECLQSEKRKAADRIKLNF
jgi:hypothetical protein